jgi:hypothetical protein
MAGGKKKKRSLSKRISSASLTPCHPRGARTLSTNGYYCQSLGWQVGQGEAQRCLGPNTYTHPPITDTHTQASDVSGPFPPDHTFTRNRWSSGRLQHVAPRRCASYANNSCVLSVPQMEDQSHSLLTLHTIHERAGIHQPVTMRPAPGLLCHGYRDTHPNHHGRTVVGRSTGERKLYYFVLYF